MILEATAEPMLRARAKLREELAHLENQLRDLAKVDPICRLMMTMSGVGAVVAMTMRAAVDDPERFHSSKDVGPWTGLTPGRHQSGERDIVGGITRAGDAGLVYAPACCCPCPWMPGSLRGGCVIISDMTGVVHGALAGGIWPILPVSGSRVFCPRKCDLAEKIVAGAFSVSRLILYHAYD